MIYTLKQKSKTWVHKFGFMETDSYCRFHQFLFKIHGLQCWKTTTSAFSVLSIYTLLCAMQRNWLFPQTDGRLVKKFPKVRGAFVFLCENSRSLIIWHRKLSKTSSSTLHTFFYMLMVSFLSLFYFIVVYFSKNEMIVFIILYYAIYNTQLSTK